MSMREALRKTSAALMTINDDDSRVIKFTGAWAHLGTMTIGAILDEADAALSAERQESEGLKPSYWIVRATNGNTIIWTDAERRARIAHERYAGSELIPLYAAPPQENGGLESACEAFLDMIADATEWKEDEDEDDIYYHLTTDRRHLESLMEALGLKREYRETPGDALNRFIGAGCSHDWKTWPETDGQEQKCMKCGVFRKTPYQEPRFYSDHDPRFDGDRGREANDYPYGEEPGR